MERVLRRRSTAIREDSSTVVERKKLPIVDKSSDSSPPVRDRLSSKQEHEADANGVVRRQSSRLNPSLCATVKVSEKRVLGADETRKKRQRLTSLLAIAQHSVAKVSKIQVATMKEKAEDEDGHRTITHSPKKQTASTSARLKISIPVSTYTRFDLRTLGGRLTADQADTRDTEPTQADHQAFIEAEVPTHLE